MSSLPSRDSRLTCAQLRGEAAEALALAHLQSKGLSPLARNVRFRFGELDLVMQDQGVVVFVEVRFRTPSRFGVAASTVDARKQARIRRAAAAWLGRLSPLPCPACRFDVVAIDGSRIDWIANAF